MFLFSFNHFKYRETFNLFIEKETNYNQTDQFDNTALHFAVCNNNLEAVTSLTNLENINLNV